jgi:hypothetical protein
MGCERWRSALTDVALGASSTPELLSHLEACADCSTRLATLRALLARIDGEIRAGLDVAGGAQFLRRVRQRAAERRHARRWLTGWPLPLAAGLGVLVLGLLVPRGAEPPKASIPARPSSPPPAPEPVRGEPAAPGAAAPVPAREAPLVRRSPVSEPAVFLRPGEAARIRALAESLRSRPVKAASLLAVGFDPGEAQDRALRALPEPASDVAGGLERPLAAIPIAPLVASRNEIRPLTFEPGGLAAGR